MQDSCKNSPLDCHQPSHHPLIIKHLCIPVDLGTDHLLTTGLAHRKLLQGSQAGVMEQTKAWRANTFGRVAPSDPKMEEVVSFDPVEWANSEPEAFSEPNAPS